MKFYVSNKVQRKNSKPSSHYTCRSGFIHARFVQCKYVSQFKLHYKRRQKRLCKRFRDSCFRTYDSLTFLGASARNSKFIFRIMKRSFINMLLKNELTLPSFVGRPFSRERFFLMLSKQTSFKRYI